MHLHDLKPASGSRKKTSRLGRGIGSGQGKTCGRGTKGQKSRRQIHPRFEGGQTPIHRRLPVKKGFRNPNHKEYAVLNLSVLEEAFENGEQVTPEVAASKGLLGNLKDGLKVLGQGKLTKKLTVSAHGFSKTAEEKIKASGGEVVRL